MSGGGLILWDGVGVATYVKQRWKGYIAVDVDLIFKIAAIGIIVSVLNQLLIRSGREEQGMLLTLAGLVVVLSMVVVQISDLFSTVKSVFGL